MKLKIAVLALALFASGSQRLAAQGASCPNPHQVCVTVPVYGWVGGVRQIVSYRTVCHKECGL